MEEACPGSAVHEDRTHWPAISFKDEIRLQRDFPKEGYSRDVQLGCHAEGWSS